MIARLIVSLSLAVPVASQLPESVALSGADRAAMLAEINRLEKLLPSAADKITVTYEIARTWAAGKQWPEATERLRQAVSFNAGLDPAREPLFASLRGTREFEAIVVAALDATPPVSHSAPAFQVPEGDLVPESMAYDPKSKQFYFGSRKKGKILRCTPQGVCTAFAGGFGEVLGLKAGTRGLWLLNNSREESALIQYDLSSGALHKYPAAGSGHELNDLVIGPSGDIYLTDTRAGAVWRLARGAAEIQKLAPEFPLANGITLSADGRLLYVSTFPDGITVLDLKTGKVAPIARPQALCLATIDGLYFHNGALIAIQNALMTPRVARFVLSRDLRRIERYEVLERRNMLFDGITNGVIAGGDFFYMANIQDEKTSGFNPITILKLHL